MLLDVEIGCGVGLHPIQYCKQNPARTLIAIEKSPLRFQKFQARLYSEKPLMNLIPIHANAIPFITHTMPKESVDHYFFLYPNPYPKKRQENKRWHAMPFMKHLLSTLKKDGKITLVTNCPAYAEEAKKYYCSHWGLVLKENQVRTSGDRTDKFARSHFEKKYLERGETCFDLMFQKI